MLIRESLVEVDPAEVAHVALFGSVQGGSIGLVRLREGRCLRTLDQVPAEDLEALVAAMPDAALVERADGRRDWLARHLVELVAEAAPGRTVVYGPCREEILNLAMGEGEARELLGLA